MYLAPNAILPVIIAREILGIILNIFNICKL